MESDESLEFSLLVERSSLFAEEVVEKFSDRVSNGELEVHEGQYEGRGGSTDSKTVTSADGCGTRAVRKEQGSESGKRANIEVRFLQR